MGEVRNIFTFLKEFNELLNPIVTEIERQLWNYKLSDAPKIDELWSIYNTDNLDELKILEIKRPELKPCPLPDRNIEEWIEGQWQKLDVENINPKEKIIRNTVDKNGESIQFEEYFTDSEDRVNSFNDWLKKREEWRLRELPRREGLNLYNNLYKLYSDIKRESESVELMLGDGHVKSAVDGIIVDHPVLLQKVNLEFNPDKPSFVIKCNELKTELYTPLLRAIPSLNQSMLSDVIHEAENLHHIADKENNIGFFKRLITVVDKNGKYVEDLNSVKRIYDGPIIAHNPILFLRKRTLGYSSFINSIIEDIDNNGNKSFPQFFQNMVGKYKKQSNDELTEEEWNYNGIDEEVLLTLPANNEQLKIVKYLEKYGAVLVQGPPGTGKTHTIANLIGHLLSQGKSVLVTSHTEKALTVLKDKVHKDLQSLCISLLSTTSQKKEMDATLFEIDEKTSSIDLNDSVKRIHMLEDERKSLIKKYKEKYQELIWIRNLDYKDLVFDNETISPIEAAKFINRGKNKYDYIPGKSNDDTVSMPLSYEELSKLYETNGLLSEDEEKLLDSDLPDLDSIWPTDVFSLKIEEILNCKAKIENWKPDLRIKDDIEKELILTLIEDGQKVRNSLNELKAFQSYIMARNIIDSTYIKFWQEIFKDYERLKNLYEEYKVIVFKNNYNIPHDIFNEDTLTILNEIIDTGKEIPVNSIAGLMKPKWKRIRNSITNNNKTIERIQDYRNVKVIVDYELKRNKFIDQIKKLLGKYAEDIDFSSEDIEIKLEIFIKQVHIALTWYDDMWISYINRVKDYIEDIDKFDELCSIDMIKPIESMSYILENVLIKELNYNYYLIYLKELQNQLEGYEEFIKEFREYDELFKSFVISVEEKDIVNYKKYYDEIVNLYNKKEIHNLRKELLTKLENMAPDWAKAIKNREGIHGSSNVPKDIELAWKWHQLNNQINRINSYDPNLIQREIDRINEQLMKNARKLAYEKAWYYKIKNTTDEQTQAIKGWRQTIKLLGKGTGKKAPMLLKKARELMPLCQSAIPVWIMPLNRVAESFDPKKNKFDVVIIDEASQANILALSALYLGEKIVIVGDDEQVSPNPVGIKVDEINALIEQHLRDIPLNHLYNEQTSIYDLAQSSGFKPLMLTEHFRCLPEIIEFSNGLSYNNKIKPLRDASQVKVTPALVPYRVPGAYMDSRKVNKVEAEHIASLICACIENEEYEGKTIGVICMTGEQQAYEIDKLLQLRLDPKEYESRKIQCGKPSQFQGDERDIIFISIVAGPNENGGPIRLVSESGRNDMYRKMYNVAASRAKDQLWVVYSLNPETDLKPDDLRLKLIKHAINPSNSEHEKQLNKAESEFERDVMKVLQNKGYKVYSQWKVGSYRIDMVVEDGDRRIAIECDGEICHTLDNLADDMKRQAILERLGWRFIRIRGSQYYKDPEETMEWVFKELESYDIKPNYLNISGKDEKYAVEEDELLKRIKRKAEEIRMEWHEESEDGEYVALSDEQANIEENPFEEETKEEKIDKAQLDNIPIFNSAGRESSKEGRNKQNYTKPTAKSKDNMMKPMFDFRKKSME